MNLIKEVKRLLFGLNKYLVGNRIKLAVVLFLDVMDIILNIIQPLLWGFIIAGICARSFSDIWYKFLYLTFVSVAQIFFSAAKDYLKTKIDVSVEKNIRSGTYSEMIHYPLTAFDKIGAGVLLDHLEGDVASVSTVFTRQFMDLLINIVKAIVISIVVARINIYLAIIIIIFFSITYYIMEKLGHKMEERNIKLRGNKDNYYSFVQDSVRGIKEIKSFGMEKKNTNAFEFLIKRTMNLEIGLGKITAVMTSIIDMLNFISQIFIFIIGAYFVYLGNLKAEFFIATVSYTGIMSEALFSITQLYPDLQEAIVSFDRLAELRREYGLLENNYSGTKEITNPEEGIIFDNVDFSYGGEFRLKNASFRFSEFGRYVICGESGSGKSTIIDLLLGLYKPISGNISIGKVSLAEASRESLKKTIAIVSQEPLLFNDDILSNIRLWNNEISDDLIKQICRVVRLDEYIEGLPDGYKTKLSKLGENISVGQKQRIAIARAIALNCPIVVFDEATSAVDGITKEEIYKVIDSLKIDHIVIEVDHRLIGIENAKKRVVVKNGSILACGTHKDILKKCSYYKTIYKTEKTNY